MENDNTSGGQKMNMGAVANQVGQPTSPPDTTPELAQALGDVFKNAQRHHVGLLALLGAGAVVWWLSTDTNDQKKRPGRERHKTR